MRKVTQKKTPDWAGATSRFRFSSAQKVRGVAPARHARNVTAFCPRAQRELLRRACKTIFPLAAHCSRIELNRPAEGKRLLSQRHKRPITRNHKLTHDTLHRTQLGSVDADFLHRAIGTASFLRALLNTRGEERFTPVLHGALLWSLHPRAADKARQVNQMDVPKTVGLHEGWHDVRAGATPPFDARCVTVAVGSLPPSNELRVSVLCGRIERHEDLSDKRSDTLYENERRSPLSILKSPPKQPKAVTIQARVEESVKTQLELYAEFIYASPSYVITEALKLLFRKDEDFRRWAGQHSNNHNNEKAKGDVLAKAV
jgi:hypothetical protein